ncbi:hypothetical protein NDU88_006604 [Pleurodeles waltl]|uniref:Uncharacterized protein n=1 Tax=Pleurodeles waltl TaxID=8319 RepID=A0AAV7SQC7_PLEWA|nr:hypothetical protein NDU88_006604 [Pleurodeles waltl]
METRRSTHVVSSIHWQKARFRSGSRKKKIFNVHFHIISKDTEKDQLMASIEKDQLMASIEKDQLMESIEKDQLMASIEKDQLMASMEKDQLMASHYLHGTP